MSKKCPFIGDSCIEHGCAFFTHLVGKNPQTGVDTDDWRCAITFIPVLLVENAGMVRKATASTDKVATEIRKQHISMLTALPDEARERLLEASPKERIEQKNGGGA